MIKVTLPPGRNVQGHPLKNKPVMDSNGNQKVMKNKEIQHGTHVACAIAKGNETHWKDTKWGRQIYEFAVKSWPTGEHAQRAFAWKIEDGDSTEPNKKMKIPCEREGFAGHWVVHCNGFKPLQCYRGDDFSISGTITDEAEIKTGDYGQIVVEVKKNTADVSKGDTAGIFITGKAFSLRQPGKLILGDDDVDAAAEFDGQMGDMPANMQLDEGMSASSAVPPPPRKTDDVKPATEFTQPPPPPKQKVAKLPDGSQHSHKSLLDSGWEQPDIDALEQL